MSSKGKKIFNTLLFIMALGAGVVFYLYQKIFKSNITPDGPSTTLFIPVGADLESVSQSLVENEIIHDAQSFEWLAKKMNYKGSMIKGGKYEIGAGWNNQDLIRHLRSGKQVPIQLIFNNVRFPHELAGKVADQLAFDSTALAGLLADTVLIDELGFTEETILSLFIPNTYDIYWTTSPKEFIDRMVKEHSSFWSKEDRFKKAKALDLSPAEVYTLASIVEKETQKNQEKPTIAGLYLNRLKKGIALQADPTVVYANKDFGIRRVLLKHLEKESPYNTYKNSGLPPGPIYMPGIRSIDAVLNAESHNYLYMCARPDNSGLHAFAASLSEHNRNASKFHSYLNKRKILN